MTAASLHTSDLASQTIGTPTEAPGGSGKLPLTGHAKTHVAGPAARPLQTESAALPIGPVVNPSPALRTGSANLADVAATRGNIAQRNPRFINVLAKTVGALVFIATAVPLAVIGWVPGTFVRVGLSLAGLFKPEAICKYIGDNEKFLGTWMGIIDTHPAFCRSRVQHAANLILDVASCGITPAILSASLNAEAVSEYFYKEIVKVSQPDQQPV